MTNELHNRNFSVWVDLFRWMAAFSVLLTHTGIRMLVPVMDMPTRSVPHILYAFVSGFDHQAVMVFFVISGLLVGGSVVQEIRATGRVRIGRYLAKRLVRLCIVLWPAFALTALCTAAALALGAIEAGILPDDITESMSPGALLCNVVFLQNIACDQFSGNGSLWSLTNEFWYYVTFPVFALLLFAYATPGRAVMAGIAAFGLLGLTMLQFTGSPIALYMGVWGIGVVVAALDRPLIRHPVLAAAIYGSAVLGIRIFVRRQFQLDHPNIYIVDDCLLSLLFGNMLLSMKCDRHLGVPPSPALHRGLARFSFSLYAIHVPLLVLYIAVLMRIAGLGWRMDITGVTPWLAVSGGLVLCVSSGWLFARATEIHTDTIRLWLAQRWPGSERPQHGTAAVRRAMAGAAKRREDGRAS